MKVRLIFWVVFGAIHKACRYERCYEILNSNDKKGDQAFARRLF
ncbi:hypothetical protein SC1083_0281 [Aggregatibacter actinomycetemcomitans serotype e str. SC1083]|uniref:Uncharacterized protein n=1 Tax=Aggregatibacter actinomycetemcomitans serotype e str. SC1083 TaxID=907488 RepID=G4A642_AGGAC|nr:hypothetical protein SC1083_0281 [Aggregatibacter actinomycetemcomitans serotype e str. SC1083]